MGRLGKGGVRLGKGWRWVGQRVGWLGKGGSVRKGGRFIRKRVGGSVIGYERVGWLGKGGMVG